MPQQTPDEGTQVSPHVLYHDHHEDDAQSRHPMAIPDYQPELTFNQNCQLASHHIFTATLAYAAENLEKLDQARNSTDPDYVIAGHTRKLVDLLAGANLDHQPNHHTENQVESVRSWYNAVSKDMLAEQFQYPLLSGDSQHIKFVDRAGFDLYDAIVNNQLMRIGVTFKNRTNDEKDELHSILITAAYRDLARNFHNPTIDRDTLEDTAYFIQETLHNLESEYSSNESKRLEAAGVAHTDIAATTRHIEAVYMAARFITNQFPHAPKDHLELDYRLRDPIVLTPNGTMSPSLMRQMNALIDTIETLPDLSIELLTEVARLTHQPL